MEQEDSGGRSGNASALQFAGGVAKVAAAGKLAVRPYWMLRTQTPGPQIIRNEIVHNERSPSHPVVGAS